jgi:hypothetical protein
MTHALVVGTSACAHIPDGPKPKQDIDFGLKQLTTPCSGALAFATWLRDEYHNADASLGTIHMFLSPSPLEAEANPELAAIDLAGPLTNDVQNALSEWRNECDGDPKGVAVLYSSGHRTAIFYERISGRIRWWLGSRRVLSAPGHGRCDPATHRFYFIDARRTQPNDFKRWKNLGQGDRVARGNLESAVWTSDAATANRQG